MIDTIQSWSLPIQALAGLTVGLILLLLMRWISYWLGELNRMRAVRSIAHDMGFVATQKDRAALIHTLESLNPEEGSGKGVSPALKNLIRGRVGDARVTVFDHEIEVEGATFPARHTAVCLEDATLDLPRFELHPRMPMDGPLDFDEPLTTGYLLRTGKTPAVDARRRLDAVMEHLADHPGWSLVGGGSVLVCFQAGRRVAPKAWPGLVKEACGICEVFRRQA